jgi:exodeoxyribonuclease VII large subunit
MSNAVEQKAISVGEALQVVKTGLESMRMRIIGEVSGFTGNRYATKYFSLKDSENAMKCIVWGNVYKAAGLELRDGLEIEIEGKFSVYPQKGEMSFHVSRINIAGEGQLRLELAQREARLRAEGLFDQGRKKPLPHFPQKIAVVTSPAGAVIHDITQTLARRWPSAEVLLFGVRVEGSDAQTQINEGLLAADDSSADLVILARGGGSFEDLLPFSSELIVRTIAGMNKPLIAGIGHEPDVSLADHVADLRAATPTAAAEAASTPSVDDLQQVLAGSSSRIHLVVQKKMDLLRKELTRHAARPVFSGPEALLQVRAMMLDTALQRMRPQMKRGFAPQNTELTRLKDRLYRQGSVLGEQGRRRLEQNAQALGALSPLKVLARGYAAAFDAKTGAVLDSTTTVQSGQDITLQLRDGQLDCEVKEVKHGKTL